MQNMTAGFRAARRGLVEGLSLMDGSEFDAHLQRLDSEIRPDMACETTVMHAIARKLGPG